LVILRKYKKNTDKDNDTKIKAIDTLDELIVIYSTTNKPMINTMTDEFKVEYVKWTKETSENCNGINSHYEGFSRQNMILYSNSLYFTGSGSSSSDEYISKDISTGKLISQMKERYRYSGASRMEWLATYDMLQIIKMLCSADGIVNEKLENIIEPKIEYLMITPVKPYPDDGKGRLYFKNEVKESKDSLEQEFIESFNVFRNSIFSTLDKLIVDSKCLVYFKLTTLKKMFFSFFNDFLYDKRLFWIFQEFFDNILFFITLSTSIISASFQIFSKVLAIPSTIGTIPFKIGCKTLFILPPPIHITTSLLYLPTS